MSFDNQWVQGKREMGVGIILPTFAGGDFGDLGYADWLRISQKIQQSGFDSIWFADHFVMVDPEQNVYGMWENFTLLSAIAAQVPDVQFGTMVACTGFRNPGPLAKMTEAIDEITGGRFILGIGAGWHKPEYDMFGYPFDYRASRFEEAITIIHQLLRTGESTFEGRFTSTNGAVNAPRGPRPKGAPILIGSHGDRMLGLLSQYADAWNTCWHRSTENVPEKIEKLTRIATEQGRDPESIVKTAGVLFDMNEGTAESRAETLFAFRELGFKHVIAQFMPVTHEGIEQLAESVAMLDKG